MKKALLFLLLTSCASASPRMPPEYIAAMDVTCFMYAASESDNREQAVKTHDICLRALAKYFRSAVKR